MATPTRYDTAIYDDPTSIYEQAWSVYSGDDDTLEATAFIGKTAVVEYIEDDDELDSNGLVLIQASSIYNEENDILSSDAEVHIKGTVEVLEDDDTISALGRVRIKASISYSENDDTIRSYMAKMPWGSTNKNSGIPYIEGSGSNPTGPYGRSSGNYDNRKPYEET